MNDRKLILIGIMVILALSLLTPYFYFIPKATLSSVIICAVLFMVEIGMVKPMWKSNSEYLSKSCDECILLQVLCFWTLSIVLSIV
jgi:MFS superfamily sulfate permease-like transporter